MSDVVHLALTTRDEALSTICGLDGDDHPFLTYVSMHEAATCTACLAKIATPSVHILVEGFALCGLPGIPAEWPDGHKWESRPGFFRLKHEEQDLVCSTCLTELAKAMVLPFFKGDIDRACTWFETANPSLGGVKPEDMLIMGRGAKLLRWIKDALAANEFGPTRKRP